MIFARWNVDHSLLGMYQDEHGIVANRFYDQALNKTIDMCQLNLIDLQGRDETQHYCLFVASRDEGQWADPKVEPIWITATKQVLSESSEKRKDDRVSCHF